MGRSKEKKHKLKENISDTSSPNKHTPKKAKSKEHKSLADEKPVGRQTNNSLASATGPILIQPGVNPHKKKLKTSQVFGQSDEDLQTGLHKILDFVKDHDDAWPFIDPVEEEYAPNYYTIIRKPMDLQKMEERLEAGYYKTFSKFKIDFELIVNNCRLYNGADNEYTEMVDNLFEAFNRAVERYLDQASSTDEEIAVEYPTSERSRDKSRKRKMTEEIIPKPKEKVSPPTKPTKKRARSESEGESEEEKESKKKKQNKKQKKFKNSKKDKEKENEKIKDESKENKVTKRNTEVLGRSEKIKREVTKTNNKEKPVDRARLSVNKDKSKKLKHKHLKREPSPTKVAATRGADKKHRDQKIDRKANNKMKKKKTTTVIKRRISRSPSPNNNWNDSPPPSSISDDSDRDYKRSSTKVLKSAKKIALSDNENKSKKKSDFDLFDNGKFPKKYNDGANMNHKDKHNKLTETIEKLKAKSDLNKLAKMDKDLQIYDFPAETNDKANEGGSSAAKKKKKVAEDNKKKKAKPDVAKSKSDSYDALSLATAETLKDINKWLDDAPRFSEFSSTSNSPVHVSSIDDVESIKSDIDPKKPEKPANVRKDAVVKEPTTTKKRPLSKELAKPPRRKEIQRTIDRLQPGKSKGNLITSVQNNSKPDELFPLASTLAKIKDSKNSLIVKTDESAPKLSLGTVLDSFGQHKFIDDEENSKVQKEAKEEETVTEKEEPLVKVEESEPVASKTESTKLDNSPGKATPNLSAWFKAFGGPKVQMAFNKKSDAKEEKVVVAEIKKDEVVVEPKKVVALPEPSPTAGDAPVHGQPSSRQRRISTGSSVSERSSFSQDMDSPRVGFDERLGAYPAPYPSPLHKSPSGASPNLRSPLPDASPKGSQYPFNGQLRVGFYQDTVSTKSSPDKSCSPRDNPQSPYNQYSEHVYVPQTTQNLEYSYNAPYYQTANYSAANNTYGGAAERTATSYYDTTKPLTDQYQAKANELITSSTSPTPQKPPESRLPRVSPLLNVQSENPSQQEHPPPKELAAQYQQNIPRVVPQTDLFPNNQASVADAKYNLYNSVVSPTGSGPPTYRSAPNMIDYSRQAPPNVEPFRNEAPMLKTHQQPNTFPVKKRAYNEIEQTSRYEEQQFPPNRPDIITSSRIATSEENMTRAEPEPQTRMLQSNQQVPVQQQIPNPAYSSASYNYTEPPLQYPPYNMSQSSDRSNPPTSIEESRKIDMSKYTNMGYQEPEANFIQRNQYKVQEERFDSGNNLLNIGTYKPPSQKTEVSAPKATFANVAPTSLDVDPNLTVRGNIANLSHIVDRFPNDERLLGLQNNPPPPPYYSDKNLTPQHLFAKQSSSPLSMFPPANALPPYSHGMQPNAGVFNRPLPSDLQSSVLSGSRERTIPAQQPVVNPPTASTRPAAEKKTKKRKTKASQQQQQMEPAPASHTTTAHNTQGFQSYSGFKSSPALEPSAISLKTASVVPGSAFNFGSTIGGGLYGDKESFPNYLDDFRSGPNYYMAAAAAAHHRATPEGAEKPIRMAQPPSNPSGGAAAYPFIGAPQPRPPNYPLGAPFMPAHQAPLVEAGSPLYQQYLQGLLGPPGAYPPGYPALGIRQPYDSMTRPSWL